MDRKLGFALFPLLLVMGAVDCFAQSTPNPQPGQTVIVVVNGRTFSCTVNSDGSTGHCTELSDHSGPIGP